MLLLLLLLLLGAPLGCAEDAEAALTPEGVPEWQNKGIFIIQSESLKKCIQAGKSALTLENCKPPNKYMMWKWVSNHHLFNIGGSGCLGLNLSDPEQPLSIHECDSTQVSLRWRCNRKTITGPLQYMVQVKHDTLVASGKYLHKWISYMSGGGGICEYLHQDLYTLKGNAHGTPCMFPFQFNHQWHHECTREGREDNLLWCATTSRYERDEKWGFCPDPTSAEVGCDAVWEKDLNSHICYQFNLLSSLSWSEAHSSCQMQGGALLSIADETEESFIRKHLSSEAVEVWMGLNQLDENAGWQWSDRAPLSYLNWSPDITFEPFVEYHCGTFNSFMPNAWRSRDCEVTLPYVCKKYLNHTDQGVVEKDTWKYYPTQCEPGWNPHNQNCYKLQKEGRTWNEALHYCQSDNSTLIDITSLAEVEFFITLLGNENASETWIGLSSNKTPVSFEWSNGSSVTFTNWHTLEPQIFPNRSQLCVSAEKSEGHWKVKNCGEALPYVCEKPGHVLSHAGSGCQEGWERHGGFCYKIDTVLRNFDHASSGYYCPPSLVTITNRFEQAFITSLISSVVKTKDSYFWIALQDQNDTGEYTWKTVGQKSEPVQYTHWNAHQPRYSGGCVVMGGRRSPPGRWEVKDCTHFKAMSLCKQPVENWEKTEHEEGWPFHPCYLDWESEPGLASCFKVFHSEKVLMKRTWREAEAFCEEFGAHLASFAHIEEENFVNELLHSKFNRTEERQFWIGFNKRNPLNSGSWEWSDGTPVISSFLDNTYFGDDKRNCAVYKANKILLPSHCGSKREWICKIPRDVRPKIPPWYQYDAPWLFYQDTEYLFHTHASEWSTFEFVCGWLRGDLLTIHSAHEQEFILSKIRALSKFGVNWWIGLQEERANGEFRWRDGAPVIYQNWDKGREGSMNNQSQRCGFISSITGLWASEECSVSMPSICKRKKIWLIEKEKDTPKQHGKCPKGWLYFNYKCLLVKIPKDPSDWKNWMSAQDFCFEEEGTLVTIESEVEQAFITMNLFGQTTDVWIGLRNDDNEKWLNGNPVAYSNWSPFDVTNIPSQNATEVQKHIPLCALLSSNPNFHFTGKWYFEDCGKEGYGFVCEKIQDTSGHGVNISDMYPIPNTLDYGNRTYKIISANMTWYTAIKTCLMHGAELVSVADQFHQSFLTVILSRLGHAHWIGLFTADNGLNFDWSDGTKSSFTFWKDDESPLLGDCVFADTNGRWSSTACETFLQGAICRVPTETKPFGHQELCSETSIPWIKFKNNCYSFSTVLDSKSFEAAHEFCKKEGSNLLTIKDQAENAFLLEELFVFASSVPMVWLNAQFDGDDKTMKWFDGTPTDLSNWGIRKPETDPPGSHLCVALKIPEGVWQLSPCQEKKGFICKMEADIHMIKEHLGKGPSHSIVPLAVALTLVTALAIATLSCCVYKHSSGAFRRLVGFRNPYYPTTNFSAVHLEENILISDFEKNDQ